MVRSSRSWNAEDLGFRLPAGLVIAVAGDLNFFTARVLAVVAAVFLTFGYLAYARFMCALAFFHGDNRSPS